MIQVIKDQVEAARNQFAIQPAADERTHIDVPFELASLLHHDDWTAAQLTFYQTSWKPTQVKTTISNDLYELTALMALKYLSGISQDLNMKGQLLKTCNVLFKILDRVDSILGIEKESVNANANTTLAIDGMTCETGCAKRIEQKIAKMEGVKSCEVNFEKKTAAIIYNDEKVASTQFVELVEGLNDNQYKVSNIETEKINNTNSESSSSNGEETGNIMSGSSFELPNIMEYLRNII